MGSTFRIQRGANRFDSAFGSLGPLMMLQGAATQLARKQTLAIRHFCGFDAMQTMRFVRNK